MLTLATATLLVTLAASTAQAAPGPVAVGSDGYARFDVTPDPGATEVWIEVEEPGITASGVVVRLNGTPQTVSTTALGTIAIVPASTGTQSFAVALTTSATPYIAVTVIDGAGAVLSSASYRPTLADYRTLAPAPGSPSGFLAATGLAAATYAALLLIGAVSVIVGAALRNRRNVSAAS